MHLSDSSLSALFTFLAATAMSAVIMKRDRKQWFDSWSYQEWNLVAMVTMGVLFIQWTMDVIEAADRFALFLLRH